MIEGGIAESAPLREQIAEKAPIVVAHHLLNDGQLGVLGLQHHQPALSLPAGTARHLSHHHKSMLVGAEVGIVEHGVGIQDSHHRNAVEVKPLGHHLRANQYVGAPGREVGNQPLIGKAGTGGVKIHPCHARFGEKVHHLVFYFLRSEATARQVRIAAIGTGLRHQISIAAIMACQLPQSFMIGERHIAVLAMGHPSAYAALHHRRKAAAVLEEYHLLAPLECLAHARQQKGREGAVHHLASLHVFHVHHPDLGQEYVLVSFFECYQTVFAHRGVVITLHRGGGGAEQHLGSAHLRHDDGCAAGMVSRCGILLFERGFVLLVDDDQSQALERQEHG